MINQESLDDAADLLREIANTPKHPQHAGCPDEIEVLRATADRVEDGETPDEWVFDELKDRGTPVLVERDDRLPVYEAPRGVSYQDGEPY